jgi:hypothetical protein
LSYNEKREYEKKCVICDMQLQSCTEDGGEGMVIMMTKEKETKRQDARASPIGNTSWRIARMVQEGVEALHKVRML